MNEKELIELLNELIGYPQETEWIEFKHNFHSPEEIGERISALANSARLEKEPYGYLVFGVEDKSHKIVGTTFSAKSHKVKKEELEHWLIQRLEPKLDFKTYEFSYASNHKICVYRVPSATDRPVRFFHKAYIRIGSITRLLGDFPEKETKIWGKRNTTRFEERIAKTKVTASEIVSLLDTQSYFDLLKLPYPSNRTGVIDKFLSEKLIVKANGKYSITNLGAILFAKALDDFSDLKRKAIRVIVYKGKNKIETEREKIGGKGYASGFAGLIDWVNGQLPANEEIGKAFREQRRMYPEIAVRELLANAIIHQDFDEKSFPTIEIFFDRIEITNAGLPLITSERFIDEYQSRNEVLADLMRRLGICEEKGSGIDKVVNSIEQYQLPAPDFFAQEKHTKVILYSYKEFSAMDRKDKIRACYQHCCLRYVSNDKMTNTSLRERFKIETKNSATVSRIIKDALATGQIKEDDPESKSRKFRKYIPSWA